MFALIFTDGLINLTKDVVRSLPKSTEGHIWLSKYHGYTDHFVRRFQADEELAEANVKVHLVDGCLDDVRKEVRNAFYSTTLLTIKPLKNVMYTQFIL